MSHFLQPLLRAVAPPPGLIHTGTGAVIANRVEAAFDSDSRRRGLLGRNEWEAGRALVIAPCAAVHTWGMRFPIDVLFVDRQGRVRKVVEALPARRMTASLGAFAAIELPAGTAASCGVRRGDWVAIGAATPP
jgi:uncharacterized membrane protein (UPF0127 family)